MVSENRSKVFPVLVFSAILLFVGIIASAFLGFSRGGFEVERFLSQYKFYASLLVGSLFLIILLFFADRIRTKGDKQYGDSIFFWNTGEKPSLPIKPLKRIYNIIFIPLITFSIIGLFVTLRQTAFTGTVGLVEQQFTVFDSILFNMSLVATSENLAAAGTLAFVVFFIRMFAIRRKIDSATISAATYFIGILAFTGFGVGYHLLRYGAADFSILFVAGFWALGGFVTLFTGNFIPFWIMHMINNALVELSKNFSNDVVQLYVIIAIVIFIAIYLLSFFGGRRSQKNLGG